MVKINVIEKFVLTSAKGVKHEFKKGIQEVEKWVADHWFTKAHAEVVEDAKAAKGFADMKVAEIVQHLKDNPEDHQKVEDAENTREKPREGVITAVAAAKESVGDADQSANDGEASDQG